MTKRLQVLFEDSELREIQRVARRRRLTVAEWVRQGLRAARAAESPLEARKKLDIVRAAAAYAFPTGEIDEILADIERGYLARNAP